MAGRQANEALDIHNQRHKQERKCIIISMAKNEKMEKIMTTLKTYIAIAAILMISACGNRGDSATESNAGIAKDVEAVQQKAGEVADTMTEHDMTGHGGEMMEAAKDEGSSMIEAAEDKGAGMMEAAKDEGSSMMEAAKEEGADMMEAAEDEANELMNKLGQ